MLEGLPAEEYPPLERSPSARTGCRRGSILKNSSAIDCRNRVRGRELMLTFLSFLTQPRRLSRTLLLEVHPAAPQIGINVDRRFRSNSRLSRSGRAELS